MIMKKFKIIKYVVISLAAFFAIWWLITVVTGVNPALFPDPAKVWVAFTELCTKGLSGSSSGVLLHLHIMASLKRFAIGYAFAILGGVGLGLFLGRHRSAFLYANPVLQILRPIAPVAWLPFLVLIVGIGDVPAEIIIFIAGFFPILLSTVNAAEQVDKVYLKVAENFGIRKSKATFKIVFPAVFPRIMGSLRLALGTCWIFLVSGEMVGSQSGLGFLIMDCKNAIRADALLATMLTIGVIGFGLDLVIRTVERTVSKRYGFGG